MDNISEFLKGKRVCLVLGDNILYGNGLSAALLKAKKNVGATIFAYYVDDPSSYGVITFDKNGDIILCQHGDRRVAKISNKKNNDPEFITIIDNYKGKRFNSPNDLSISKNGDIYFTDPPFVFFDLNTFSLF